MENTSLTTDRLILKPITPAVIHDLYNTKTKEEIIQFFATDEAGYEHYLSMHKKGMESHNISLHFFLLTDKITGTPMGECGFHTLNKKHRRAELFYSLRNDEYKQKGFMTEALAPILAFGFHELNLHRIAAFVADWNTASVKLLEKYGFTKEGTMREDYCVDGKNEDSDCYSLLKTDTGNPVTLQASMPD